MIRVGTGPRHYLSRRAFDGVSVSGVRQIRQPCLTLQRIAKVASSLDSVSEAIAWFLPASDIDLYHTCNRIVVNRKPWLLSFESVLPRFWGPEALRRGLFEMLARKECRAILALSENARAHLAFRNRQHPALPDILKKVRVVYPGVEDDTEAYREHSQRPPEEFVHLVFVGTEFFRKGGDIAVESYTRLAKKYPVRLTVVSSLSERSYLFSPPKGAARVWKGKMADFGVNHIERLPMSGVRRLLARADFLLLPTLDDSFGFSVVEAMATGVIPVATRVRALGEIVSTGIDGLLVDVPVTEEGRLDVDRASKEEIADRFTGALRNLLENPDQWPRMARKARETYEERFSETRLARELKSIYRECAS